MSNQKTLPTDTQALAFIEKNATSDQRRTDCLHLLDLMQEVTGHPPVMWGPSIIGFGHYHYRYASGHEGDAPLLGFSPRKGAISLYAFTGLPEHEHLLTDLGKFKMGKACIYVNKLSDIHTDALRNLMKESVQWLRKTYE